eukprot:TRINITY_DN2504_c9_g1_i1.p1 TRINITY_DN2504_c9_g1~~TRINITY_DN2504_c9_g1_i1.p1  ORF type:complete len:548 (+),score=93.62 TRINITY_DN2504_c9_g1_i1:46-1689(+)
MTAVVKTLSTDVNWSHAALSDTHAACSTETEIVVESYLSPDEMPKKVDTPLGCDTLAVGSNVILWSCFNVVNVVHLLSDDKYSCCTDDSVQNISINKYYDIVIVTSNQVFSWKPFHEGSHRPTPICSIPNPNITKVRSSTSIQLRGSTNEIDGHFHSCQSLLAADSHIQFDPLLLPSYELGWIAVYSSNDAFDDGFLLLHSLLLSESWEVCCQNYCLGTTTNDDFVIIISYDHMLEVHDLPDGPGCDQPLDVRERRIKLPENTSYDNCLVSVVEKDVFLILPLEARLLIIDVRDQPTLQVEVDLFKANNITPVVALHNNTFITSTGVVITTTSVKYRTIDPESDEFYELKALVRSNTQGHNEMYVKDRILENKLPITFQLVAAKDIESPLLKSKFDQFKSTLSEASRTRFSFHGTHPNNIHSIVQKGLLPFGHFLSTAKAQVDEGYFGSTEKGIYVSKYVDYSLQYSNNVTRVSPSQEVDVLMLATTLGVPRQLSEALGPVDPTPLYNSHVSPNGLEWYLFSECQCFPYRILTIRAVADERTAANDF